MNKPNLILMLPFVVLLIQIRAYFGFSKSYYGCAYSYFWIRRILGWSYLTYSMRGVLRRKYDKIRLEVMAYFIIFKKILNYVVLFVFTSTHKYVLLRHHCIYKEIRSYLYWFIWLLFDRLNHSKRNVSFWSSLIWRAWFYYHRVICYGYVKT